jgi:hypothetical protein
MSGLRRRRLGFKGELLLAPMPTLTVLQRLALWMRRRGST